LKEQAAKEAELSPEQQRERLLIQVKADNQEIAGMERKYDVAQANTIMAGDGLCYRMNEAQQALNRISTELEDLDTDDVEADGKQRRGWDGDVS
jgi:hypothetical protein